MKRDTPTARPDWRRMNEPKDAMITRIDAKRAGTFEVEPAETVYEWMVRVIGQERADWLVGYTHNQYQRPNLYTQVDHNKATRYRKRLREAGEPTC